MDPKWTEGKKKHSISTDLHLEKECFIAIFTDFLEVPYQLPCNFEEVDHLGDKTHHHLLSPIVLVNYTNYCLKGEVYKLK